MELEQYNFSVGDSKEKSFKDILLQYVYNWKWFVLSIAISMVMGYYNYRSKTPIYEVNASILIKDDKKGGDLSELSAFADLDILNKNDNIDNEIEIFKSRYLMLKVVKELHLNISYFIKERPRESELFSNSPVNLNYNIKDSTQYAGGEWVIIPQSNKKFKLQSSDGKDEKELSFGSPILTEFGSIIINQTSFFNNWYFGQEIIIRLEPEISVAEQYKNAVQVSPTNKNSSVLVLSLQGPLIDKSSAILNNLIKQHNLDAIEDKNLVSNNTANFINDRIKFISSELSGVEGEAEDFKIKNKLTDVESEAKLFLESGKTSELSLLETGTQLKLAEFMYNDLNNRTKSDDLMPSNLGLQDASINILISEYNKLVLERGRLLKNASESNPVVVNLDARLVSLRLNLKESLANLKNALSIQLRELDKEEGGINTKIAAVPKYEREYRMIQRQQQIKETLYLYLLQKREETNIALAVTVANTKVIDYAYSSGEMVAPKKFMIYFTYFMFGFILPVIVFTIINLLDTKVHDKRDVDAVGIPFLGDIPLSNSKEKLVVQENDNSSISESFRLLRTNIEYVTSEITGKNKTIFITSTISKEGKSFIALNLSASIALSGKKTLLIGTDLRNPKILTYLSLVDKKGVTNFVMDKELKLDDIIFRSPSGGKFDILVSGPIPPNPAELLMNPRVKEMFDEVKSKYDYIIVDTAPVGMVADTLLINKYADATVFVARANFLDRRMLRIAETLNKEKRLPNMSVLINGAQYGNGYGYYYGYGYGYGYGQNVGKEKPWWKKVLAFISFKKNLD